MRLTATTLRVGLSVSTQRRMPSIIWPRSMLADWVIAVPETPPCGLQCLRKVVPPQPGTNRLVRLCDRDLLADQPEPCGPIKRKRGLLELGRAEHDAVEPGGAAQLLGMAQHCACNAAATRAAVHIHPTDFRGSRASGFEAEHASHYACRVL